MASQRLARDRDFVANPGGDIASLIGSVYLWRECREVTSGGEGGVQFAGAASEQPDLIQQQVLAVVRRGREGARQPAPAITVVGNEPLDSRELDRFAVVVEPERQAAEVGRDVPVGRSVPSGRRQSRSRD